MHVIRRPPPREGGTSPAAGVELDFVEPKQSVKMSQNDGAVNAMTCQNQKISVPVAVDRSVTRSFVQLPI